MRVSVVIITRNEESNIVECIHSAKLLSDEIIVVDSKSNDTTVELAKQHGAKIFSTEWESYGASKNMGAEEAKYDWIFSLDADERITPELAHSIKKLNLENTACAYQCNRINYLGNIKVKLGTAGFDKVIRLYNRHYTKWDLTPVHENLIGAFTKIKIQGPLIHYSAKSLEDYKEKISYYAKLSAQKYFEQDKKASFIKRFVAPFFNAFKSYIFQLGFLDGATGYRLSKMIAYYTWLKYHYLHRLNQHQTGERNLQYRESQKSAANSTIVFLRK